MGDLLARGEQAVACWAPRGPAPVHAVRVLIEDGQGGASLPWWSPRLQRMLASVPLSALLERLADALTPVGATPREVGVPGTATLLPVVTVKAAKAAPASSARALEEAQRSATHWSGRFEVKMASTVATSSQKARTVQAPVAVHGHIPVVAGSPRKPAPRPPRCANRRAWPDRRAGRRHDRGGREGRPPVAGRTASAAAGRRPGDLPRHPGVGRRR